MAVFVNCPRTHISVNEYRPVASSAFLHLLQKQVKNPFKKKYRVKPTVDYRFQLSGWQDGGMVNKNINHDARCAMQDAGLGRRDGCFVVKHRADIARRSSRPRLANGWCRPYRACRARISTRGFASLHSGLSHGDLSGLRNAERGFQHLPQHPPSLTAARRKLRRLRFR